MNSASKVDKVISKTSGKIFARKRIAKSKVFGGDKGAQKVFENEIRTLSKVSQHDHLIKVMGTYSDKKYIAMLLDPVANGNLKQFMTEHTAITAEMRQWFKGYFGCLAHTLQFLHEPPIKIIHKDIKPENVLLKDGHLILTDFGTAFDWSKTGQSMTRSNHLDNRTPRYQSPEVYRSGEFHRSSDIWSLGVLFLEMTTFIRGKTIDEMDRYLKTHGQQESHIHVNLEATMKWFEILRDTGTGSVLDNEPLVWIQQMLNREHTNRPSASVVYNQILAFQDGEFCGLCCKDEEAESESENSFVSETEMETQTVRPIRESQDDFLPAQADNFQMHDSFTPNEYPPFSNSSLFGETTSPGMPENSIYESDFGSLPSVPPPDKKEIFPEQAARMLMEPSLKGRSSSIKVGFTLGKTTKPKAEPKSQTRTFLTKESVIKWLGISNHKWKPPARPDTMRLSKKMPCMMESRRIGHFLSTLPAEAAGFEHIPPDSIDDDASIMRFSIANRSHTFAGIPLPSLKRSTSQEDIQVASNDLTEEAENERFADIGPSNLVHSASETDLAAAQSFLVSDQKRAIAELKEFAANMLSLPELAKTEATNEAPTPGLEVTPLPEIPRGKSKAEQSASAEPINSLQSYFQDVRGPGVEHLERNKRQNANKIRASPAPNLFPWVNKAPSKSRKSRFESATVIMERILENKKPEAPTTVMSARTKAMISTSRPVTRWNDRYYGWLPNLCARGQASAVRDLLSAGCNPGTKAKPRWGPIYSAVRGGKNGHIKCLRALVEHGGNVNARRNSNNRTPLHYAIERELWGGYSTIVYILLAARADPNARDDAGDTPLLMLLVGMGKLPQERRDALYLLLAPNFDAKLDIRFPGTLDNPLHLAIRRKDAYVVDAILQRIQFLKGDSLNLIHDRNASGFTAILLAFSIFKMTGDDAAEELHIVKLLLEHGANPDDQDTAQRDTPLHHVVRELKNGAALEMLCGRNANIDIQNKAHKTSIEIVTEARKENPDDEWTLFAFRRMKNTLKAEHYRPQDYTDFVNGEPEQKKMINAADNVVTVDVRRN